MWTFVHMSEFPFVHTCRSESYIMSEYFCINTIKAQVGTVTHVDMWTFFVHIASKHTQRRNKRRNNT
jgi:hypothetical protein